MKNVKKMTVKELQDLIEEAEEELEKRSQEIMRLSCRGEKVNRKPKG